MHGDWSIFEPKLQGLKNQVYNLKSISAKSTIKHSFSKLSVYTWDFILEATELFDPKWWLYSSIHVHICMFILI